jgi:hypothetical protein
LLETLAIKAEHHRMSGPDGAYRGRPSGWFLPGLASRKVFDDG